MTTRLTAQHRREQILAVATELSRGGGLYGWTLQDVADAAGLSRPGVAFYYGHAALRARVVQRAVEAGDTDIVMQALARYDPLVADIPDDLREACAEEMRRA